MNPCVRPDCLGEGQGRIDGFGFCDRCHRRPLTEPPDATGPATGPRDREADPEPGPPPVGVPEGVGDPELLLPAIRAPKERELLIEGPQLPPGGQQCRVCWHRIGVGYGGQPAPTRGFCPNCRTEFSFEQKLEPGQWLADHKYQVVGCLALGGQGWIYLARDFPVEKRQVALKSMIDANDPAAEYELRYLARLDHPHIVRVFNNVVWEDTRYIVMEFVRGRPLSDLLDPHLQQEWLGTRLRLEHVVVYGCLILGALGYLHHKQLLYCDMAPGNVMHHDRQIKLIDLGGVRAMDKDDDRPGVRHLRYLPNEELRRHPGQGFCVSSDLYAVAETLRHLAEHAERGNPPARDAFQRVVERATSPHLQLRFGTAADMALQLRGVLRDARALASDAQHTGRSLLFSPFPSLLDGGEGRGLGTLPTARDRLRSGPEAPELDIRPPAPEWVAARLPTPVPHPHPRHAEVAQELQRFHDELTSGLPDEAARRLSHACELLGHAAARDDWRVAYSYGLLLLARGDRAAPAGADAGPAEVLAASVLPGSGAPGPGMSQARRWFEAVHRMLPGEPAPKLALASCVERDVHLHAADAKARCRDLTRAKALYETVWKRDRTNGSAAFGLARLHLAEGERTSAVDDVLRKVPPGSPSHRAARIAASRVQAGWLPNQPPGPEHFEAVRRLAESIEGEADHDAWRPNHEERLLLGAEIREAALRWIVSGQGSWPPKGLTTGELFGSDPSERGLRELQEKALRALARRATSRSEHDALVDRANEVRPETRW